MSYPVFIICRNWYTNLLELVSWLERIGNADEIYLIDNASTYQPLLDYFETTTHKVIRLGANIGHTSPWVTGTLAQYAQGRHFVVTDPDVLPVEECPDDALHVMRSVLDADPGLRKAGFSLKIDDLPDHYPLKEQVIAHESQFWNDYDSSIGAYRAALDTTFALYNPWAANGHDIWHAARTAAPYVARHLPWYVDPTVETDEQRFYREAADRRFASWTR